MCVSILYMHTILCTKKSNRNKASFTIHVTPLLFSFAYLWFKVLKLISVLVVVVFIMLSALEDGESLEGQRHQTISYGETEQNILRCFTARAALLWFGSKKCFTRKNDWFQEHQNFSFFAFDLLQKIMFAAPLHVEVKWCFFSECISPSLFNKQWSSPKCLKIVSTHS